MCLYTEVFSLEPRDRESLLEDTYVIKHVEDDVDEIECKDFLTLLKFYKEV